VATLIGAVALGLSTSNLTWLAAVLVAGVVVAIGFAGPLTILAIVIAFTGLSLNFLADVSPGLAGLDSLRILLVFGGCGILLLKDGRLLHEWRRVSPYLVFLAFAAASVAWSPSQSDGLRFWSKLAYPCLAFLLTSMAVRLYGDRHILSLLWITAGLSTAVNLVVAIMGLTPFTGPGYEGRFAGTLHPNSLGLFCVTSALIMYGLWTHYRKGRFAIMMAVLLAQLVGTGSRTAMIAGGAAFMLFDVLRGRFVRVAAWAAVGVCVWVAVPTLGQRTSYAVSDSGVGSSQMLSGVNLSGRSTLWGDVWAALMGDRQVLGHGVGATEAFFETRYEGLSSVHNGYVQIMVDLGFVGITLLLGFFLLMVINTVRRRVDAQRSRPPYAELTLALLLALMMTSFTESTFAGYGFPVAVLWITYGLATSHRETERPSAEGHVVQ
jgi:O-antigen ligase